MRGIDYKSLYEDLVMKLDAIEEKVIAMGQDRLDDDEFRELADMISDALYSVLGDHAEEAAIDLLCRKAAKGKSHFGDTEIVDE